VLGQLPEWALGSLGELSGPWPKQEHGRTRKANGTIGQVLPIRPDRLARTESMILLVAYPVFINRVLVG